MAPFFLLYLYLDYIDIQSMTTRLRSIFVSSLLILTMVSSCKKGDIPFIRYTANCPINAEINGTLFTSENYISVLGQIPSTLTLYPEYFFFSFQRNLTAGENTVTYTVEVPEVMTKAIGDGTNVNSLVYEVWKTDEAGERDLVEGKTGIRLYQKTIEFPMIDGRRKANVTLNLVKNQNYTVLFWAQNAEAGAYNTSNLTSVTYKNTYGPENTLYFSNQEGYAAFYHAEFISETSPRSNRIELRRPFAQVNIATTNSTNDGDGAELYEIKMTSSKVTIKNAPTVFNVAGNISKATAKETGEQVTNGATPSTTTFVFDKAYLPNCTSAVDAVSTHNVAGQPYEYAAMNYIFANGTVDVTYEINTVLKAISGSTSTTAKVVNTVYSVPVEENYRTNIVGNLLTSKTDYEIIVDAEFNDEDLDGGKYGYIDDQKYVKVEDPQEFNEAFVDPTVDIIILSEDVVLTQTLTRATTDYTLTVAPGKTLTIDLNGKKISSTSTQTGGNYNMFDVRGTLTVKNGTIEYEHLGENMGWNSSTNIFNVTAGGVLNIVDAEVNNNGGSDMGFVAHLNNWGEVTLNVENSVLTSNYVAVRVFNSGNDMNNVKIANSTLQGANYAFWVHNYTVADFGTVEKAEAHKALLNLDIFGNGNTFVAAKAPVRYGFTNSILVDENGVEFTSAGGTESEPQALEDVLASINTANPVIRVAEGGYVTWTTGASHGSTPLINAENNVTETVTICGSGENSYLVVDGSGVGSLRAANGAKLIFKNITIIDKSVSYAENAWEFTYLEFAGNLEFDNVTFKSGIKLQKEEDDLNAVFTDCTFITEENDVYAVWVSDGTSAFEGCKVQGTRGIKAHEAYGSEVTEIVIDGCEFGPLSKKPGVALGTLNAATRVVIQNSVFAGCQAGDQGNYIYETDTDVTTFEFVNSNNTVR